MKRVFNKFLAIGLVAIFLGVNAWLPFQIMGHAQAHAHHQATTHATPLCTLLCSAGHIAHNADPTPPFVHSSAYNLEPPTFISRLAIHVSRLLARGPPARLESILFF